MLSNEFNKIYAKHTLGKLENIAEIKEYLNNWMGINNIVKMSTLPKMINRFYIIPVKSLQALFCQN